MTVGKIFSSPLKPDQAGISSFICLDGGAHHEQHIEFPKGDPPDMSVGTHIRVLHQFQLISMKKKIPDWQKN